MYCSTTSRSDEDRDESAAISDSGEPHAAERPLGGMVREAARVLDAIAEVLRVGGDELTRRRGLQRRVERKRSVMDVVTDADLASEAAILARIAAIAPDDGVLSEEAGFIEGRNGRTWVIDPLDGTTNYTAGIDDFGVIVGVVEGDETVAGGMLLPSLDLLYLAERGGGATRNGTRVQASKTLDLRDVIVDHSLIDLPEIRAAQQHTLERLIGTVRGVRCSHSLRYMAYVAQGNYDGFVYHCLGLWDLVGTSVILREAGAEICGLRGEPLNLRPSAAAASATYAAIGGNTRLLAALVELVAVPAAGDNS